jgi:hypothetical protein
MKNENKNEGIVNPSSSFVKSILNPYDLMSLGMTAHLNGPSLFCVEHESHPSRS